MQRLYKIMIALVILGHIGFAGMQALAWPTVAERLLGLTDPEAVEKTASVGTSFASYNLSIAIGIGLSFLLTEGVREKIQLSVLSLIVFTAVVGFLGTGSMVILGGRLLPATIALLLQIHLSRRS
ncbi:DUF1304 family protein [Ruegeria sp. HKCCD8929]|uniref:DUF1304 family protein n=1 Tax=Ruegeria sp. HKCCD8929 TaxID=2683006 RepID=UPI001489659D|nr:DUF1304 family protein [Ruegeria sp. HKCCD8929]